MNTRTGTKGGKLKKSVAVSILKYQFHVSWLQYEDRLKQIETHKAESLPKKTEKLAVFILFFASHSTAKGMFPT